MKLTNKEQNEPINITLGRLRMAIISGKTEERQLALLEKISAEIQILGIKYPKDLKIYE